MQLEVIEDEVYRLAALAGVLAGAMPLGNNNVNPENAPATAKQVEDQIRMTLPYVAEAFDGKSPIEKDREAAVEQYKEMYRRMMKDAINVVPPPPVTIKKIKGARHA